MKIKKKYLIVICVPLIIGLFIASVTVQIFGVSTIHYSGQFDQADLSNAWKVSSIDQRHNLLGEIAGQNWHTYPGSAFHKDEEDYFQQDLSVVYGMTREELFDFLGQPDRDHGYSVSYRLKLIKPKTLFEYIGDEVLGLGAVSNWFAVSIDDDNRVWKITLSE